MTNKSVWATLSAINCNDHVALKGTLSYLSWSWAWQTLNEHYPESTFEYFEPTFFENGTVEVSISVTVESKTHKMWLPVMGNRNEALVNPDSRAISDARQRCLVKCIGLFGLGLYIYAGEGLPEAAKAKVLTTDQAAVIKALLEETGVDVAKFCKWVNVSSVDKILAIQYKKAVAALEAKK
tara:strand:- start:15 stop:557 length:543 start_codon:yes stop_codon:yes gene_type:complete